MANPIYFDTKDNIGAKFRRTTAIIYTCPYCGIVNTVVDVDETENRDGEGVRCQHCDNAFWIEEE